MRIQWEPVLLEIVSKKISEVERKARIARLAEIIYSEVSQLEKDPIPPIDSIEPKYLRATSDHAA